MILQALTSLYDALAARGTLEQPGWSPVKVSWGLELGGEGEIRCLLPLQVEVTRGNKKLWAPRMMSLPTPVKRTVGIAANFLCDNASYVLGVDGKGKPERAVLCFEAFRKLHQTLMQESGHPAAHALLAFLERWSPERAAQDPVLAEQLDEICKGGNLIFLFDGQMLHEIPEIRALWQAHFSNTEDAALMQCLVTGRRLPVQVLHPSIKGVQGAQSSGASLVSFNARSLESYGYDGAQGLNAPVSTQAAFAYGAALNYLLASPRHRLTMADTTVVYWAEDAGDGYADLLSCLFGSNTLDDDSLNDALRLVAAGKNANWNGMPLHPDNRFYILGLAPNAARLSVRFFLSDTFGALMKNVAKHQQDLQIVKPAGDMHNELSLWWLLNETVSQKAQGRQPHPQMAGDLLRAILQGTPYPATLFEQVEIRIRAERKVTRGRAAIIKAYLLRQPNSPYKEVLTVQLNEETRYAPYLLGRLFSVLEALQQSANPGINTTIRDRYFSSACATPAIVFPTLLRLAQAHLKKLNSAGRVYYDKQIGQILSCMDAGYPARLSLQDQGVFQLGYYHQTQKRFEKKEEQNNG